MNPFVHHGPLMHHDLLVCFLVDFHGFKLFGHFTISNLQDPLSVCERHVVQIMRYIFHVLHANGRTIDFIVNQNFFYNPFVRSIILGSSKNLDLGSSRNLYLGSSKNFDLGLFQKSSTLGFDKIFHHGSNITRCASGSSNTTCYTS